MNSDIKDLKLAPKGKLRIEWAGNNMPVLNLLKQRFKKEKPLKDVKIGACLHVTAETANLMLTLKEGGAILSLCASNPLSTQDDVAASLVKDFNIPTFAIKGENNKTYYKHLQAVLSSKANITMDDGADLINIMHKQLKVTVKKNSYLLKGKGELNKEWEFYGSSEETTTGVIRLKAMEDYKALKVPVVAVNDSDTKHFFDNRYGTGQSTIDGIIRATNILLAGKSFVVVGYGWCGRGLANRARGMGANVVVCEIDPIRSLEAVMDGFSVMRIENAAKIGDIFVTATGNKGVISLAHIKKMKDGAILANTGHFNVEIEVEELEKYAISKRQVKEFVVEYAIPLSTIKHAYASQVVENKKSKRIFILGEGRLINLVAAEGHPPDVMDMSFANQALACEWFIQNKGKLKAKVYRLPQELDLMVASLKLKAMGVEIDKLTKEQKKYLTSYSEGT